jgi:general secretion pathway protein E
LAAGMLTMRDDGQRWVNQGITSLDEVIRVTRD